MAVVTKPVKLELNFLNALGTIVSFSFKYADKTAEGSDVAALMAGMIANGAIFEVPPTVAKSAKFVETTETDVDLSA